MPRLQHAPHEAFAKEYAKNLTQNNPVPAKKIYKRIYANVSNTTADSNASRLLSSTKIQDRVQEIINLKNPVEEVSQGLADMRNATKQVYSPTGQIVELKDNPTRLGAINTWCKIMGVFGQDGTQVDARSVTFNMNNNQGNLFESVYKKLNAMCDGMMSVSQSTSAIEDTNNTQASQSTEEKHITIQNVNEQDKPVNKD